MGSLSQMHVSQRQCLTTGQSRRGLFQVNHAHSQKRNCASLSHAPRQHASRRCAPRVCSATTYSAYEKKGSYFLHNCMALLVVAGLPCSGRTTRVNEIAAYFEKQIDTVPQLERVLVLRDSDIHVSRDVYACTF